MTTRKQVRDQIIGKTMAAGINPTTVGIARNRLVANAARRLYDCGDAICSLYSARDSGDLAAQAIAAKLLENPEFCRSMLKTLESIKADIVKAKGAVAAKEPAAAANQPSKFGGTLGVGPDYPESDSPSNQSGDPTKTKGSGLPGTDARQVPGSYSKEMLMRDIATQNTAAATLARSIGVDAANARVAKSPLVPPWDSPAWSPEARAAFRQRATIDGWAAEHLRAGGGFPAHRSEYEASRPSALDRFYEGGTDDAK